MRIIRPIILFLILSIMVNCSSESNKYAIDGIDLPDFPEVEFLWNLPLDFKYGLPGAGPIVFKDKDGSYIERDENNDYSEWCEYAYLLEEISTQWYLYVKEKAKDNFPEISGFNADYIAFHAAHPEVFQEYIAGLSEIQESLNLYLMGEQENISNKDLAEIIDQVYVRDHRYLGDFTRFELNSDGKSHYAPNVEKSYKENPAYISNGVVIRFMSKKYEPHSTVDYVTFDGMNVPEGTLWISRERKIDYTDN